MTDADERLLYAYVVHRVRDRSAAEDLTAEVFHMALASVPRDEWRGAPCGAWLIRIAANAVADRRKRAGREVASASPPEQSVEPEVDLAEIERSARLFRLVNELPANSGGRSSNATSRSEAPWTRRISARSTPAQRRSARRPISRSAFGWPACRTRSAICDTWRARLRRADEAVNARASPSV